MGMISLPEIILWIVIALLYFLPSYLGRKNKNFIPILLINIFLGWTLLGWLGALIWAIVKTK